MKQKIAYLLAGLIIYSIFGVIMVYIATGKLEGQWTFIISWTLGMTIIHVLVIEPFRKYLNKKNNAGNKNGAS